MDEDQQEDVEARDPVGYMVGDMVKVVRYHTFDEESDRVKEQITKLMKGGKFRIRTTEYEHLELGSPERDYYTMYYLDTGNDEDAFHYGFVYDELELVPNVLTSAQDMDALYA